MKVMALVTSALIISYTLSGCGGGGGDSGGSHRVVAVAGLDHYVGLGETVTLDGSASYTTESTPLIYDWEFLDLPKGSTAGPLPTNSFNPVATFVADAEGTYEVQLTVSDSNLASGIIPDTDTVKISAPMLTLFGGSDNDKAHDIRLTIDGGYIVAGGTASMGNGGTDFYLIKIDDSGLLEWEAAFGGIEDEIANSIVQADDGGYVAVGNKWPGMYILKTDSIGNLLWDHVITPGAVGRYTANSIQKTIDGGYIVVGKKDKSIALNKFDSSGNHLWESLLGQYDSEGHDVQQTPDGGYIIAGQSKPNTFYDSDVYLVKTDINGSFEWEKTFGSAWDDVGYSIRITPDGGYAIAGEKSFESWEAFVHMYLVKTDSNGNLLWENTFLTEGISYARSLQLTSDGGYAMTGGGMVLVKADASGNYEWHRSFGGARGARGYSLAISTDNNYVIAGSSGRSTTDAYVVKTDGVITLW